MSDSRIVSVRRHESHRRFHTSDKEKCLHHTRMRHCNTLQHTATHCNTMQHTATHCTHTAHTQCVHRKLQGHSTHTNEHCCTYAWAMSQNATNASASLSLHVNASLHTDESLGVSDECLGVSLGESCRYFKTCLLHIFYMQE